MLTAGHELVVEHKSTASDIGPQSTYWRRLTLDSQVSNYIEGARALNVEPRGVLYDVVRKVAMKPYLATPVELREYTKPKDKQCPECKKKKSPFAAPHTFDLDTMILLAPEDAETLRNAGGHTIVTCADARIVTDPGGKLYANMREADETPEEYRLRVRADIAANPDKYYQRGIIVRNEAEEREAAFDAWTVGREIREAQLAKRWPRNPDACDAYNSLCAYFDVCTGVASIDDPTLFRTADTEHEELADGPVVSTVEEDKRHLPVLSTSAARAYRSCPKKYFFSYELRKRRLSDAQVLRFGTLLHRALEAWWTTGDLAVAYRAMSAGYSELEIDHVDQIRAEELMLGYHTRWHDEPLQVLAVEQQFRAPLVNPETGATSRTWVRGGKIDALARVLDPVAHADTVPPAAASGVSVSEGAA